MSLKSEVLNLSLALGAPELDLAILAEGNASGSEDSDTFWIKASGFSLSTLQPEQLVKVRFAPFGALQDNLDDTQVRAFLSDSKAEDTPLMPSVETFMHAYLLKLPEIKFVGHTHPTSLLSLLVLQNAEELSKRKLFPDDVVCCGPASAFVSYCDPGLPLAQEIRRAVERYMKEWEEVPKTIWLANHGLIALGKTRAEVTTATQMASKAAKVWLGAMGSGETMVGLSREQILRIHSRPDEHYRQRILATLQEQNR